MAIFFGRKWFGNFCRRHQLRLRTRTNTSKLSHYEQHAAMQEWHKGLRKDALRKTIDGVYAYDGGKWGICSFRARFNMDEVGFQLQTASTKTWCFPGERATGRILVRGGRESRVATMCLPTCGDRSVLVPPAMIFRGGGKVSAAMKAQLDVKKASSDVHYTFQAKAWIDEQRLSTWKHADKVRT